MIDHYKMPLSTICFFLYNDLMKKFPDIIPVFPLNGVIYFPNTNLPLNIFEQRYLDLVNDAYNKDKFMGMVQSKKEGNAVYDIGCLGKISDFQKSRDGRILINLTGISRFNILKEISGEKLYRVFQVDYKNFGDDLKNNHDIVDTENLIEKAKVFFKKNGLLLNWREFEKLEHYLNQGFTFDRVIVFIDVGDILDENRYFIKPNGTVATKSNLKFINTVYQDYSELYKLKKTLKELLPLTAIFYSQIMKFKSNSNIKINESNDNSKIQDNYLINSRWTYKNKFSKKDQIWVDKGKEDAVFFMNKIFELSKVNNFRHQKLEIL